MTYFALIDHPSALEALRNALYKCSTYLLTHKAAWYIILAASVCLYMYVCLYIYQMITFESLGIHIHICTSGVSPQNMGGKQDHLVISGCGVPAP